MRLARRRRRASDKAPRSFRELSPAELKAVVGGCGCPLVGRATCLTSKATACV